HLEESLRKKISQKAFMAPTLIVMIFSPVASPKIPEWEQFASASCAGYALALAAFSMGLGAVWKSFAFDPDQQLKQLLQLKQQEKLLGWINVGTPATPVPGRDLRPPMSYTTVL